MNPHDVHPIAFFNEWFGEPFDVRDYSVAGTVDALNRHPIASDQTAQDYIMPMRRCREHVGRFRVYGENQDVYYCFVYEGDESKTDPPVYFESCLDLHTDYGIAQCDIIDDDHVLVAERFTLFLWQVLGHHICLRMESGDQLSNRVTGVVFNGAVELDASFINQLGREFPAGYTCFVSDSAICIPDSTFRLITGISRFGVRMFGARGVVFFRATLPHDDVTLLCSDLAWWRGSEAEREEVVTAEDAGVARVGIKGRY